MSGPVLAVVANDVEHMERRMKAVEDKVAFLIKGYYWVCGAAVGFGIMIGVIAPKLMDLVLK